MTKLCARGKSAAKRKFKVYPSAYANAYASKICAGKAKDPSGVRRKDWGPKKASKGAEIKVIKAKEGSKKTSYLKKKMKGVTIGSNVDVLDNDNVTSPRLSVSGGKGNHNLSGSIEKPFDKKGKRNYNSDISLGYTKESKNSSLTVSGNKRGKDKRLSIGFTKTFSKGGALGTASHMQEMKKASIKTKKVAKALHKASGLHKAQAKTLETIKLSRGGGAAIRGLNFQGVK